MALQWMSELTAGPLFLKTRDKGARPVGTATGFVAQAPAGWVLVTNRHVFTGRHQETGETILTNGFVPDELEISHHELQYVPDGSGRMYVGSWSIRREALYEMHGQPLWREHPTLGPDADVAALPLTDINQCHLVHLDFAKPGTMAYGPADPVSVIGYPFGLKAGDGYPIWVSGYIASEPNMNAYKRLPVILIDCRSRPGQSGSPVVMYRRSGVVKDEDGGSRILGSNGEKRLLGIYSGRIRPESDIGMVWRADVVAELVASVK